jgi:hypothetical protein
MVFNRGTAVANITRIIFYDDLGTLVEFTSESIPEELQSIGLGTVVTSTLSTSHIIKQQSMIVILGRIYVVRFYTSSGNVYEVPMICGKTRLIEESEDIIVILPKIYNITKYSDVR